MQVASIVFMKNEFQFRLFHFHKTNFAKEVIYETSSFVALFSFVEIVTIITTILYFKQCFILLDRSSHTVK